MKDNKFVIDHLELRYYQSIYYDFFVPLYIIMLAYDYLLYKANIKNLACQMIIVARKGDEAVDS